MVYIHVYICVHAHMHMYISTYIYYVCAYPGSHVPMFISKLWEHVGD